MLSAELSFAIKEDYVTDNNVLLVHQNKTFFKNLLKAFYPKGAVRKKCRFFFDFVEHI